MSDEQTQTAARYLCRCEEVTEEEVLQAFHAGALTVNDIKRRTRFGMGLCQGAYCLCLLPDVGKGATGSDLELEPMTPRPPTRSISLGALADLDL